MYFFIEQFPWRFGFLGAVGSGQIEEELVLIGLVDEVRASGERFDFIELLFHEVVDGFDVGLEAMLSGWDGAMGLPVDALDGAGECGVVFGLPGSDELRPVVALPGGGGEIDSALLEMFDDALGEDGGVGQRQFVGVAEEEQPGGDIAGGVLVLGEVQPLQRAPIFGDIAEILGVDVDLLAEVPVFFDLAEESFGLRLLASPRSVEGVITADPADGFDAVRQLELVFDASGGKSRAGVFGGEDFLFGPDIELAWPVDGGAGVFLKAGEFSVEAVQPLADGLGGGLELSCGRFDAVCFGVDGHVEAEDSGVLGVAHDGVVCIRAHVVECLVHRSSKPTSCVLFL